MNYFRFKLLTFCNFLFQLDCPHTALLYPSLKYETCHSPKIDHLKRNLFTIHRRLPMHDDAILWCVYKSRDYGDGGHY